MLLANVVHMADAKGGWKAATTSLWREHLHAATMAGRVASAREAVRLGYGIEPDDGPSGRLGHWKIAGIPDEAMTVLSKRSAEIQAEAQRLGRTSYRAKGIIARETRARKRHEPIGPRLGRWRSELEAVGWPVPELNRSIAEARARSSVPELRLDTRAANRLATNALSPDGPLAARKVFCRRDVVVAVAPHLYGRDPADLDRVVEEVLRHADAVPLLAVEAAHERPYATASTIAREEAIAASVGVEVARTDAPAVDRVDALVAIARSEHDMGDALTVGQRAAVLGITTSGRGVDLVVGIAGSGNTTALAAVRDAYESAGYEVVGTSTSGQAARTLHRSAEIQPSRTLASLVWRLDHHRLRLSGRHVVVLDEAAMTDDAQLQHLLRYVAAANAKLVLVGDHRQLGAVGPGGGFEALVARFGPAVHVLDQNVRQRDVEERAALAELRDGDVAKAVAFYAGNDRIATAADRAIAIETLVEAWAADLSAGRQAMMYAWRRANVAELNRWGREVWRNLGRLGDEELVAPGGTTYAVGDRVVSLAPGDGGKIVTSETGTVVALDDEVRSLAVRMDDGGAVVALDAQEIGHDRLAHAYAVTVHRSQGSTVERAHALEDGGGRELAYVKMSRAKERSTVYVVADSTELAIEDLRRDWAVERRLRWVVDRSVPVDDPPSVESDHRIPRPMSDALRLEQLRAERDAIEAVIPPDPRPAMRAVELERQRLVHEGQDLKEGTGTYRHGSIGEAHRELATARSAISRSSGI